ncbi:MAG TPA: class I SAM-dependent RNA methyltransferase [Cyclobacteriaceae bacterium]|jgi:putative N6-adenine-specific DNA methylase
MVDPFRRSARIIVTCSKRLAPYLETEIAALGYQPVRVFQTGVELHGSMDDCIVLNLSLRCASQVLYSLGELKARDPDGLYQGLTRLPWEEIISPDDYFSVTSNVSTSSVNNALFVNVRVKDAIADRIRNKTGRRPDSGAELKGAVVHVYWRDHQAEVFIDTSGETLAKHGYRKIPGKAPMLESLAAATIMASQWDPQTPFINPMCGSGTLATEAALLATNRKPGLYRAHYSFMHVNGYQPERYHQLVASLKDQVKELPHLKIVATDISLDAIRIAKANAESAGVAQYIHFEKCDFEKTPIPVGRKGVIFFNPEYGERLGEVKALERTYKRIGDFMKQKCQGYTGCVFTGNPDLAKKIGLRPARRIEFYSAKIDCRLLRYELYAGSRET